MQRLLAILRRQGICPACGETAFDGDCKCPNATADQTANAGMVRRDVGAIPAGYRELADDEEVRHGDKFFYIPSGRWCEHVDGATSLRTPREFKLRFIRPSPLLGVPPVAVPSNTVIVCANCGFEYEIGYSKTFEKAGEGRRICLDCVEGLGAEDLPFGLSTANARLEARAGKPVTED